MKLTLENARGIQIHGYRPGEITLKLPGGDPAQPRQLATYRSSLILTNVASVEDWVVTHVRELELHHFDLVWQSRPGIVLLGTGRRMIFPEHGIRREFAVNGIGFETMDTPAACRTYNVLASEGRDVMALLIID